MSALHCTPWEAVGSCVRTPYEMGNPDKPGMMVADVARIWDESDRHRVALLIAAAPDLLEALKAQQEAEQYRDDLFALCTDGTRLTKQHSDKGRALFTRAKELREAAIVKATGGAA